MSVLSELCLPFVQKKGIFAAMKGANIDDELEQGKKAIQTLGGNIQDVHSFSLPIDESERTIVIIEKQKNTPKKYTRKPVTPNRQPIKRYVFFIIFYEKNLITFYMIYDRIMIVY